MREIMCDTLVIGAGGGGYPAAFRLARAGHRVVMADPRGNLGGHCLYEGCIPSKAVREGAQWLSATQRPLRAGVPLRLEGDASDAWLTVRAFKDAVQARRYDQHRREIEEAAGLTMAAGRARFEDERTAIVETADDTWRVRFRYAIVATGSSAVLLPIAGGQDTWTSHALFAWQAATDRLPRRLVVIGAGYIGVEIAMMLKPFGVEVTLLEATPHVLPQMDPDIRDALATALTGVARVVVSARVTGVSRGPDGYTVRYTTAAGEQTVIADQVLTAVGRRPNVDGIGLEAAGVAVGPHGIVVDAALRTSVPHIYATGDVTGLSMLFHAAVRMSQVAAANILADPEVVDRFDPHVMPATVFAFPEAHTVGYTLEAATASGIDAYEVRRPMGVEARAQIGEELEGFLKFVVRRADGVILGVHAVGIDAADLSSVSQMIVQGGYTLEQVARLTFPHPTQFEAFDRLAREAAAVR